MSEEPDLDEIYKVPKPDVIVKVPKSDINIKVPNEGLRVQEIDPRDMPRLPDYLTTPALGYEGFFKFYKINGFKIPISGSVGSDFFDEINRRRNKNESVIIVITGSPGKGKTYSTIRLAQILDKAFYIDEDISDPETLKKKIEKAERDKLGPKVRVSQVEFDRQRFLFLIGNDTPLEYGQCIIADEAQYAMGARRWYEDIQKDLMEAIESVRSRGFIILIVALHLDLLDLILRKFVLSFMVHLEDRGRATVYRLYTPRFGSKMHQKKLGSMRLMLPGYEGCRYATCLRCEHLYGAKDDLRKCKNLRAIYERRKKAYIGLMNKNAQVNAQEQAKKKKVVPMEEILKTMYDNRGMLQFSETNGRVQLASLQTLADKKLGINLGLRRAMDVRSSLEMTYSNEFPTKKPKALS